MLKSEFTKKVKEELELSSIKAAEEMIDKFTALLSDIVKSGDEAPLGNLGKFVVVDGKGYKLTTAEANPNATNTTNGFVGEIIEINPNGTYLINVLRNREVDA